MKTKTGYLEADIRIESTVYRDTNNIDFGVCVVYWGKDGLSWLQPGYDDSFQSVPTFRQYRGEVQEVDGGLELLIQEERRNLTIKVNFSAPKNDEARPFYLNWKKYLEKKGFTPEQEADWMANNLGVVDGITR